MPTPDTLIPTDTELQAQIQSVFNRWDVIGCNLELFIDDEQPLPTWTTASYTQPGYTGYAPIDLNGKWADPVIDESGVWSFRTSVVVFEPTSGDGEEIQGFAINLNGTLVAAGRLTGPFTPEVGSPLAFKVIYVQYSSVILEYLTLL